MKKLAIISAFSVLGAMASAQLTGNLYLSQADDLGGNFVNQEFGDFPTFTTGIGNVVTFGTAVNLTDVQIRMVDSGSWIANGVNTARLTISQFSGTPSANHTFGAASAGGDIAYSAIVNTTINNVSGTLFNFTADASGVTNLAAGTYLVSLTGIADFGARGQAFTQAAVAPATDGWYRNPGGAFGLPAGTGWGQLNPAAGFREAGMGINGEAVPEPATMAVLGLGVAALARRRRNK